MAAFFSEIRKCTRSTPRVELRQEYTLQLHLGLAQLVCKAFPVLSKVVLKTKADLKTDSESFAPEQALGHFPNTRLHFFENAQRKSSALSEILPPALLCCNYSTWICKEILGGKFQCFSLKKESHPALYVIRGPSSCGKPPTSFLRNMASCGSWRVLVYLKRGQRESCRK